MSAGIAVVRPDGTGFRQLTGGSRDRSPAWSPDGRWLAFQRGRQIYVIRVDGKGLRRLTPPGLYSQPAWSPDGNLIAFVRGFEPSAIDGPGLFVMRADGTRQRRIYRQVPGISINRPAWSPNGTRIALGLGDSSGSIVVVKRRGGGLRFVTDGRIEPDEDAQPGEWADDSDPDWSPDGKRIVFSRLVWLCPKCDQYEVFSVNADGSDVRWITTDTSYASCCPSWSPDGNWIVAATSRGIAIFSPTGEFVRVVSPLGSEPAWQPLGH